jgi:hypothetical protein
MSNEEALAEEVRARRYALHLRLAELAELAARTAVQIKIMDERRTWPRQLESKIAAVREAALLLDATER